MLAEKLLDMNVFELRYFSVVCGEKMMKTSGIHPMKMNLDWPSVKQDAAGTWPPANPNWFKQQDMMAKLGPFVGGMGGGAPAAGAGNAGAGAKGAAGKGAAAGKDTEAPKKDKTHYDIELTKFEPTKKIALIKEIRAVLGLGLKEAKEMVEGAPVWLKKEMKKADAEKLAEKLKGLGGTCKLA